jgi:hypothetical protein
MNGFLLPHDIRQLSLLIPMYGCTNAPDRGPAIQTKARSDLLIPSERRYGDPFESSTDHTICKPPILKVSKNRYHALLDSRAAIS